MLYSHKVMNVNKPQTSEDINNFLEDSITKKKMFFVSIINM